MMCKKEDKETKTKKNLQMVDIIEKKMPVNQVHPQHDIIAMVVWLFDLHGCVWSKLRVPRKSVNIVG